MSEIDYEKLCDPKSRCLMFMNSLGENSTDSGAPATPMPAYDLSNLTAVCSCVEIFYKCNIYEKKTSLYKISSPSIREAYLIMYAIVIAGGCLVNFLTLVLLINEHNRSKLITYCKYLFHCGSGTLSQRNSINLSSSSPQSPTSPIFFQNHQHFVSSSLNKNSKYARSNKRNPTHQMNLLNDVLFSILLLSYLLFVFFLTPVQTYLFASGGWNIIGSECRIVEFFKSFTVTLSTYSLAAISLQRLISLKNAQYTKSLPHHSIWNQVKLDSIYQFFRSILAILGNFLNSKYYCHHRLTVGLSISVFLVSGLMGFFNMNQYKDAQIELEKYDVFTDIGCRFDPSLISMAFYCKSEDNYVKFPFVKDMIFLVVILLIPDLIVFSSYARICIYIWVNGNHLKSNYNYKSARTPNNRSEESIRHLQSQSTPPPTNDIIVASCSSKTIPNSKTSKSVRIVFTSKFKRNKSMTTMSVNNNSIHSNSNSPTSKSPLSKVIRHSDEYSNTPTSSTSSIVESSFVQAYNKRALTHKKSSDTSKETADAFISLRNQKLTRRGSLRSSAQQKIIKKRNLSVTLTMVLMAVIFNICWAPFFIFPFFYQNTDESYKNYKVIVQLVAYSSCIWNPIILIIKSKRFKLQLHKIKKSVKTFFKSFITGFSKSGVNSS